MRRRIRKLSSQIFLAQTAILAVSIAVGFVLLAVTARGHLDEEYQARAAAIAQTFAQDPVVQQCLTRTAPGCDATVQHLATATERRTGAAYVVVIDTHRVRHSHPNPALIGKRVSEPLVAADGEVHLDVNSGATGVSANARVPLDSATGAFIGEVSVGIRESSVSAALADQLPSYAVWFAVMLVLGALASLGVAARMKRRTFGLELDEIAHLLLEREATLHGIREGVVAVDPSGRMSVVNDEALRLLALPPAVVGRTVHQAVPAGPIRDLLSGSGAIQDRILLTEDHSLVVCRLPVRLSGRPHGTVVTLQDRTVVEGLARELDGARSLTESMRAQQHEFSNRLHAIAGLLELGRPEDALEYVNEIRGTSASFDQVLREHVAAPQLAGLLLGKAAEANELGIELVVTPDTVVGPAPERLQALTTILGNLIDNAFDALTGAPAPRRVEVTIASDAADGTTVVVHDTGPGVPAAARESVFVNGYSTKAGPLSRHSGLGLALVHRTVTKLGGTVELTDGPGATFVIALPPVSALAPSGSS